jgi:hypothetical protein
MENKNYDDENLKMVAKQETHEASSDQMLAISTQMKHAQDAGKDVADASVQQSIDAKFLEVTLDDDIYNVEWQPALVQMCKDAWVKHLPESDIMLKNAMVQHSGRSDEITDIKDLKVIRLCMAYRLAVSVSRWEAVQKVINAFNDDTPKTRNICEFLATTAAFVEWKNS